MRLNARIARRVALSALLLLGMVPWSAQAQQQETFVRLYYSSWMTGEVAESPADPTGVFTEGEDLGQNPMAGLEVIFLNRFGVSFVRQKMQRQFRDLLGDVAGCTVAPCVVDERAVHESINFTLYGREVAHDQFNLFAGGGAGQADYSYLVDGIVQTHGEVYDNQSLARWFAGLEYTFERIGFRLEVSQSSAHKSLQGESAKLKETFRYFTLVIPLN